MNANECRQCGDLFWPDDPEQEVCPTCLEEPVAERNRQRAIEVGGGDGQGAGHLQGAHELGELRGVQPGRQDPGLGE